MKQVLASLRTGEIEVADVPCPRTKPGHVLIATRASLISAGTERMIRQFGSAGLLGKMRQQPERMRQVLDKLRTDGLGPTLEAVRSRLDQPVAMGYSNVGLVLAVGDGVQHVEAGDRVVSNGPHAEVALVPRNLCVPIPDGVTDEQAAFAVVGAIALQGLRLAAPAIGESFAVIGLGLVGLLTVQLLAAQGCHVLGFDFNQHRLKLAAQFGANVVHLSPDEDPVPAAMNLSRGRGVDGVLIAAATDSSDPVRHAARMCRRRGRVVLVGVTGLELSRSDFYEKELSFQVSCSYGPGRYDPRYEQGGQDYPHEFVRWTAGRNFEAVIDQLALRRLRVEPLISHRFALERAAAAYDLIESAQPSLGVLLQYPAAAGVDRDRLGNQVVRLRDGLGDERGTQSAGRGTTSRRRAKIAVGVLGAGNFASRVLIPELRRAGARLKVVCSDQGLSSVQAARRHGIPEATTDAVALLERRDLDAVVIATRHDSHAEFVCRALRAGKHVFVEKPLALTIADLQRIEATCRGQADDRVLAVGFNRRFAPQIGKAAALLAAAPEPKSFIVTVNAGPVSAGHWTQDPAVGGGRIIGEACHWIDLVRSLCGHPIVSVQAATIGVGAGGELSDDSTTITLQFADGSSGTIHYLANGHRGIPKERLEVFCAGRVLQLDNFRRLRCWGWPGFHKWNLWRQNRGHAHQVQAFVKAVATGGRWPTAVDELIEVTRASFDAARAARTGETIRYGSESAASHLEKRAA